MLSVVMYSRNDDYGFKLKHRTALAINLWADALSIHDEIIFVDDNTPNGRSTLPEELERMGSMTDKCKSILRILKVTPEVHATFGVNIPVAEQHCRNIGIRHATNPWTILTTTDNFPLKLYPNIHELVEEPKAAWCSIVQGFPLEMWSTVTSVDALYRIAVMWDRILPGHKGIHDEFVHQKAGDMLIAPTELFFEAKGLEEGMVNIGCGESTVMKKITNLGYSVKSCANKISIMHLEHSTVQTPNQFQTECPKLNDWDEWVTNLPKLGRNSDDWGLYPVEEIDLCVT